MLHQLVRLGYKFLCAVGICFGGVKCHNGQATCGKCGYCDRYGKAAERSE